MSEMWIWDNITVHNTDNNLSKFAGIYTGNIVIENNGNYKYVTILQLIIQIMYFKVSSCIYRLCSDTAQENKNIEQHKK